MRESGLFDPEEIRPLNETRMRARWKLGRLLAKIERPGFGPGRGKKKALSPLGLLMEKAGLEWPTVVEAERIGTMPDAELEKELARCHEEMALCTFRSLLVIARPYWYQESRERKHRTIEATAIKAGKKIGPFAFPVGH
jgi:hypothetical protein